MSHRLLLPILALVLAFLSGTGAARASLVWTPDTGWRIEGGALSMLTESDNASAVELMNKARAAEEKGSLGSAIRNYNKVAKRYARSIYAPEALYRAGLLRVERQQWSKAFEAFDQVIRRYPNYGKFNELIGYQYRIASDLANGRRGRFLWIFPGFTNRDRGIQYLESVVANAPFSEFGPNSLELIAKTHRKLGDVDAEIDALDRFINTYNLDPRASTSYLELAQAHEGLVDGPRYDQGATRQALSYFEDFSILYPRHPQVGEAEKGAADMRTMLAGNRMEVADWYYRYRDNFTAARILYNEAITIYPDSPIAVEAKEKIGRVDADEAEARANPPSQAWRYIDWLWR